MAFHGYLRQSTATTLLLGPFQDSTDGNTDETTLTIAQADVLLWKEGGTTLAQKNESTSCTHRSSGLYTCPVDTTDTNTLGLLSVNVHESGALAIRQDYQVIPDYEYDAMFGTKILRGILSYGTAQSATGTTVVLPAASAFGDDTLNGSTVVAEGSTQGYGQARAITDYVGSTDTATVDTWTVTPSGTIKEVVFAGAPASSTVIPAVNATQFAGQTITAAAGVTLPSSVASPTNITAGTITTVTNLTNAPTSGDLTTTMKASVNAEVVDVIRTDTVAELTAPPAANAALSAKINWLFMKARNVIIQTATTQLVKADDGTTTVGTSTVSDNGTTATRGEFS